MHTLKYKRLISVVFIIFLVFSGIYLIDSKLISEVKYICQKENTDSLCIKQTPIANQELCSEEVLGMKGLNCLIVYGRNLQRNADIRAEMNLLLIKLHIIVFVFLLIMKIRGLDRIDCKNERIIGYMHHQDGKKEEPFQNFIKHLFMTDRQMNRKQEWRKKDDWKYCCRYLGNYRSSCRGMEFLV